MNNLINERTTSTIYRLAVRLPGSPADKLGKVLLGSWYYTDPTSVEWEIAELERVSDEVECYISIWDGYPGNAEPELCDIKDIMIYEPLNEVKKSIKVSELNKATRL